MSGPGPVRHLPALRMLAFPLSDARAGTSRHARCRDSGPCLSWSTGDGTRARALLDTNDGIRIGAPVELMAMAGASVEPAGVFGIPRLAIAAVTQSSPLGSILSKLRTLCQLVIRASRPRRRPSVRLQLRP